MSIIVKPFTFSAGATIVASEHNSVADTIYNDYNGNGTNANLSASAAIALSKISFTTALAMSGAILRTAKGADVASAAGNIALGTDGNYFDITGTAAITSITAHAAGTVVTLQFDSTASLVDGGNLKLTGNFTGAAESQIMLVCDATNWFEIARSTASFTPSTTNALSKSIIQTVITKSSAVATDSGVGVDDDTIPTVTECPIITAFNTAITASSASNTLIVTICLNYTTASAAGIGIACLFLDSDAAAISATRIGGAGTADMGLTTMIQFSVSPADTSAHTYKLGIGGVDGVITVNGAAVARKLGGVMYSSMRIDEIKA